MIGILQKRKFYGNNYSVSCSSLVYLFIYFRLWIIVLQNQEKWKMFFALKLKEYCKLLKRRFISLY